MYAIMQDGCNQFKVEQDQVLRVAFRAELKEGDAFSFDKVSLLSDGSDVKVGTPTVEGAKVNAVVLQHGRDRKVVKMMFKRRKSSKTKSGHRQRYTQIKITSIEG